MGRWAQARRRGGKGSRSAPNFPKPLFLAFGRDAVTNKLEILWTLPITAASTTLQCCLAATPNTAIETIVEGSNAGDDREFVLVPTSGFVYICTLIMHQVGFADTTYYSNTVTWP